MSKHRGTILDLTKQDVSEDNLVLLSRLDVQGDGKVRTDDLIQFVDDLNQSKREKKQWKCVAGIMTASILAFIAVVFGLVVAGFQMTKETKVSNDVLVTNANEPVVLGTVTNSRVFTALDDLMVMENIRLTFSQSPRYIDVFSSISATDSEIKKYGGTILKTASNERLNFWVNDSVGVSTVQMKYRTIEEFAVGTAKTSYSIAPPRAAGNRRRRRRRMQSSDSEACVDYPELCGGSSKNGNARINYKNVCRDIAKDGRCKKKKCNKATGNNILQWYRCAEDNCNGCPS